MLIKCEFIWLKCSKNNNVMQYYCNFKWLYCILIYLNDMSLIPMAKLKVQMNSIYLKYKYFVTQ